MAALRRLTDFDRRRVLEMGCGEGRLTLGVARAGGRVFAFDPDAESVAEARRSLPDALADRVSYRVAGVLLAQALERRAAVTGEPDGDAGHSEPDKPPW